MLPQRRHSSEYSADPNPDWEPDPVLVRKLMRSIPNYKNSAFFVGWGQYWGVDSTRKRQKKNDGADNQDSDSNEADSTVESLSLGSENN